MVQFATLDQLGRQGRVLLEGRRQVLAKAFDRPIRGSTFLSHSSNDGADYIAGAAGVLEQHGASVYLDKKDPSLPPHTNRETAEALKDRIRLCERFVLFATRQSSKSRWVPWELGISDGYKTPRNVAVFPGVENTGNTTWTSEEYLGAYDRIVHGQLQGYTADVWMVWNAAKNTARELSKWIAGG